MIKVEVIDLCAHPPRCENTRAGLPACPTYIFNGLPFFRALLAL